MKSLNNELWNKIDIEELEVRDEFGCVHIDCWNICWNCWNICFDCISPCFYV